MRDRDDSRSNVPLRDGLEAAHTALSKLYRAFTAGHRVMRIATRERLVMIRVARLDLRVGKPFEYAEAALSQIALGDDGVCGFIRNTLCSLVCAAEIAAVQRRKGHVFQAARELTRLVQAEWRERAVVLALHATLLIPERFAVADEQNFSQLVSRLLDSCSRFPAA